MKFLIEICIILGAHLLAAMIMRFNFTIDSMGLAVAGIFLIVAFSINLLSLIVLLFSKNSLIIGTVRVALFIVYIYFFGGANIAELNVDDYLIMLVDCFSFLMTAFFVKKLIPFNKSSHSAS